MVASVQRKVREIQELIAVSTMTREGCAGDLLQVSLMV